MKVKIKNYESFFVDEGYGSRSNKISPYLKEIFDVYGIIKNKSSESSYILVIGGNIGWYKAQNFEVVDSAISNGWIEINFPKNNKLKNKHYNFHISINYFYGPQKMLENEDFLFDLVENKKKAKEFLNSLNTVI